MTAPKIAASAVADAEVRNLERTSWLLHGGGQGSYPLGSRKTLVCRQTVDLRP